MENTYKGEFKRIIMPNGRKYTYYRDPSQTWNEVILEKVLPDWMGYCNDHWIDFGNHESMWSFEKRTKAFLDRCAWLWLQDHPDGLESRYKEMMHKVREIPASECADGISDYFYSDRKPADINEGVERFKMLCESLDESAPVPVEVKVPRRKMRETRFNRLSKLIRKYPNAKRMWCSVDGDNNFTYNGNTFHIPETIKGYEVNSGRTDLMDRVFVLEDNGVLQIYNQELRLIEL